MFEVMSFTEEIGQVCCNGVNQIAKFSCACIVLEQITIGGKTVTRTW